MAVPATEQARTGQSVQPPSLVVFRVEIEPTDEARRDCHDCHQLLWAPAGTVAVQISGNDWVVPPTHGLWIPAGVTHTGRALRSTALYLVDIAVGLHPTPWSEPTGVVVGPLMRELIVFLSFAHVAPPIRRSAEGLLVDLLEPASLSIIHLPLPRDPRAREVAEALINAPDDDRDLGAWGLEVGASIRTLARLFAAETGMTFAQWRGQARMRAALGLLAEGVPVATVACRVGYRTPSAFVLAFHRLTGRTPGASPAEPEHFSE